MRRRSRLNSASLENHLDGGRVADTPLARVLSAARAPALPDELAGLPAARTAFVQARHGAPRHPRAGLPAASRTAAGRLLAIKAVAALGGATLIGGVAYASNVGILGGSSPQKPSQHTSGTTRAPVVWNPGAQQPGVTLPTATEPNSHQPHPSPNASKGGVGPGTHATPSE